MNALNGNSKLNQNMRTNHAKICELIMPLSYFSPWLFESIYKYFDSSSSFSPSYQIGILIAYKILCKIVIKSALSLRMSTKVNYNDIENEKKSENRKESNTQNFDQEIEDSQNIDNLNQGNSNDQIDEFYCVTEDFMDLFYLTLHSGLRSNDKVRQAFFMIHTNFIENFAFEINLKKNIINCIIQSCNTNYWHLMLESSSLLIKDFIDACASIDLQV